MSRAFRRGSGVHGSPRRSTRLPRRIDSPDTRLARARLVTFFSSVALALLVWQSAASPWWLLVLVAVFAWLVRRHARILRARELAMRGIGFYECGLARLEDRWPGTGAPGERFRDGLITTHDLALTAIADQLAPRGERALSGLVRQ